MNIFIKILTFSFRNALENITCEMAAILFRARWVKHYSIWPIKSMFLMIFFLSPQRFGSLVGLCKDPMKGTIWVYTSKAVFKYKVIKEARSVEGHNTQERKKSCCLMSYWCGWRNVFRWSWLWNGIPLHELHKSRNAPVPYPTMFHIPQCTIL